MLNRYEVNLEAHGFDLQTRASSVKPKCLPREGLPLSARGLNTQHLNNQDYQSKAVSPRLNGPNTIEH